MEETAWYLCLQDLKETDGQQLKMLNTFKYTWDKKERE